VENYYTYIIESTTNQRWYIGHTNNIDRRLDEHNSGQNNSTKGKGPWKLIFLKEFDNNLDANRFELKLKKLRNKKFIKDEYSEFFLT
jgi:putative endonuclease